MHQIAYRLAPIAPQPYERGPVEHQLANAVVFAERLGLSRACMPFLEGMPEQPASMPHHLVEALAAVLQSDALNITLNTDVEVVMKAICVKLGLVDAGEFFQLLIKKHLFVWSSSLVS